MWTTKTGFSKDQVKQARRDWNREQVTDLLIAYTEAFARLEAREERQTSWVVHGGGYMMLTLTQEHFDVIPGRWEWMTSQGQILYGITREGQRIDINP